MGFKFDANGNDIIENEMGIFLSHFTSKHAYGARVWKHVFGAFLGFLWLCRNYRFRVWNADVSFFKNGNTYR